MSQNNHIYDVVVIGGGPGGLVTAYQCSKNGLSTLVLERDREIGVPVRCAEGIMNKALDELGEIPESVIASQIKQINIIPPNKIPITVHSPSKGVILHRELFDKFLAKKALMYGTKILLKHDVKSATYDESKQLFNISIRNQEQVYQSRILVAADGIDSQVGRWFGMSQQLSLADIDSCAQYLVYDKTIIDGQCSFIFDNNYAPGGYVWIFTKGANTANIGLGVNPQRAEKPAQDYLDNFLKDYYPHSNSLRLTCGGVPVRQTNPILVKNRVMLVGDSAYQTNAISGGGIDTAISAGILCGQTIAKAVTQKGIDDKKLLAYQNKWHAKHKNKEKIEQIIKDKIVAASNPKLDKYFDIIRDISLEELNVLNIFKTLIVKNPKLFAKVSTKVFFDFLK
jgi:digeranylgeranylglycerophospholipid reductase